MRIINNTTSIRPLVIIKIFFSTLKLSSDVAGFAFKTETIVISMGYTAIDFPPFVRWR